MGIFKRKENIHSVNQENLQALAESMIEAPSAPVRERIYIKKLRPGARLPARGSDYSAGFDAYATASYKLHPGASVLMPTGFSVAVPNGWALMIFARSSVGTKKEISPTQKVGIIDPDYRGEVYVPLKNYSANIQFVEEGDKVAQLVPVYVNLEMEEAEELPELGTRGSGGFGSTGK